MSLKKLKFQGKAVEVALNSKDENFSVWISSKNSALGLMRLLWLPAALSVIHKETKSLFLNTLTGWIFVRNFVCFASDVEYFND